MPRRKPNLAPLPRGRTWSIYPGEISPGGGDGRRGLRCRWNIDFVTSLADLDLEVKVLDLHGCKPAAVQEESGGAI
jgi:hypothetical protein